ncbi:uncharacterized protein LOC106055997 isoform X2 [Biomphalaria glabrata]|uniref:Uncharacterized protein LOC106055997 isoform X2 n=1 Tax=Biomphalaria glabrata TaxID=6526 RepID=A0A9W3A6B3_BIOGL|nr:uncharacterized protein LOC106055997 isoform X2 [Biomphalaria glabrata]
MGAAASTENEEIVVPESSMPQRSQPHFSGTSGSQDVVKITKDGFYPSEKSITEGEDVLFEWDETAIGVPNLIQVVNDGKELKPVVDGYGGSRGPNGTLRQRFYLGGQYKFAVNPIRFTPFTVTVKKRSDIIVEVTDDGFFPAILDINQGQGVHWVWRSCSVPHTVKEYTYLFNKRAFQPKDQKIVATISGAYQQSFRKPGVYYFKTESSEPGKSPLCVVRVRNGNIEHKIDVLDHTFEPLCLVVQEGDRVWWEWTKEKCTKMHNIFQINAPPLDHEADSNFEPTSDGFQWPHKPSKQGLLTHKFTKAGVYFYSDRNYDEAAIYMGTIIVKPKPKEHVVKINDLGFSPDILRVNTDELVWMIWNTSSYSTSGKLVQIVEEDKVLGSTIETRDTEEIDADPVKAEDLRVMTKAGIAFLNFSTTGVYTYKLIDKTNKSISAISMIANPGPKNHTVNVTDFGFEPQVVSIRPNDRVWWLWQHVKKQHNIVQVSHSKNVIPNGFCSGLPRDGQSAFHHQFCNSGVFYFKSEKIPDIYGSIVVSTEPNICCQVHEIEVAQKEPETTTVQINDIVCWTFPVPVDEDVVALKSLNEALKSPSENTKLPTKRRCIAKPIKKIGITPFFSKSFVKFSNNINVVVCDERTDFVIVRVFKEFGFRPKEIYLQKGQNLKWTWIGTDEAHNIINFTYQNSNDSQDKNSGKTYIHSGKPVINSSFVFPFDDPGDYLIISEGAPSHSCSVHVKDSIPRSSAPNISSQSELINDRVTVFLETTNPNADIYYTTDGTLPALHLDGINHYKPDEGITMKKSGIVRAIALVKGEVQSYQVTSLPIWIETKEEDEEKDTEEVEDAAIVEPQKQNVPSWWLCRPEIQGCFTGPGLFEVFWKLPELEEAKKLIKGYNIFLNDVCYCTMFPPSNNRVGLTGLAGGRTYQIYVVAYPKDPKNTEIKSKNLYAKCPILTEDKGPVISIVKTEKRDSIAIVWMSIDKSDCPIDGYLVFLNDTQCGPKLVPDANSNRCKVVIDGCDLDMDYKIHVQAVLKNFARTLISNMLYIRLPLNTADFVYPDIAERREDEDLYNEYIEVVEGSGYQTNIDNQASEVWETETDTTSGLGDNDLQKNDGENAFRAGDQDNINDPDVTVAPIVLPGSDDEDEKESVKHLNQIDDSTVFLDAASNKETVQTGVEREFIKLLGSEPGSKPGMGLAIIEVQKSLSLDKIGHQTSLTVPAADLKMTRVNEGELVPGDDNGLLPTPSIMARSIDRQTMEVGWRLTRQVEPPHELQLYVVNVMGTKFSSHINSDISYECNLVENGRQVRGVQHCWNIDKKNECIVQGLLTGNTYRTYVVCNFCMTSEGETCETQTSSPVLYYTIVGPPSPPTIQTTKVDTYQVCLEWAEQANEKGLQVRGFQIYVDEKSLGKGRSADVRTMTINNLVPGKTMSIYVTAFSEFGQDESEPSRTVHITCPPRPTAPVISQQPSYKRGSVLIGWTKPESQGLNSREEAISFYVIYLDGKWHGEVKSNQLYDKQGYRFYLTDLSPEQSYDVSVKAVAGERIIDQKAQHIYCLSESPMSNIIPVMAPAAPRSPKLRLEGLHPEGIDVTWQIPQQLGDAFISGYQMLKNGKLYGSIIPPDVNSLSIRDVILGEKIELQLIALTEHPVGKSEGSKDSGRGTSSQEEKTPDIFTGDHYAGCKPGPKLVVHYTGLVSPPSEVWCEKATGHSLLIVWTKNSDTKAHFVRPDSYQVTWWPGDRAKDEIQSDSTTDDHLLINGLRPSTSYTVVVEARKTEKYTDFDEAFEDDKSEGLNSFILSSKSEQLHIRTASPPDPPSNVGIVAMTCHSIKVGWDPPREHGSEIIGIRVECISQDPDNAQVVSADTLPDATSADLTGLSEKTDYLLKVITVTEEYFDQLPEKNRLKQMRNFPPNISSVQEESQWLPFTCILFKTSGTEPPCNVKVIKATMTALTLNWTPPLVYGTNKLTGQIVRWSAVRSAQQNKDNDLHIASHVKLLPTEDTLTIDDLLPGTQYNIVVEAVVSVKTSLEPEKWDGNNIEKNRRTAHVLSKPLLARTRAPIDPPQLMVTSYTQNSATLTWEKPKLVTVVGKDSDGNPKCLRRYLQGYKLEINGKLQTCIGPDSTSCTLTKCKPGRNYSVVLVAVSCTAEGRKARKQKYEHLNKESNSGNVDYMSLLQEDENLDEAPSDPLSLVLPRDQDGFLESLEAKFQPVSEKDTNIFGDIELSWKLQGNVKLVKQFSVVWYSMEDRVIQTKFVSPEQRRCTIPVSRIKTIYTMKVEPSYYSDVLSQQCQEIQLMVPGPPDAPQIFLRSLDLDEFSIEWGEPSLYGGVKVKGYQVLLNDIKAGSELTPRQTKATIPCKPKKTYRVNVIALSDNSLYGDSPKSNTLVINSSGQAGTSYEMTQSDDYGIPVKVVKVLENSIHLDWSNFVEKEELAYYTIQWSSVAQPDQREVKLSKHDTNCVINKCLPGTTHFMRVIALSTDGQILEKSKQMTIQTSAPPDVPKLSVRACNFHYIAIQWNKPTTYGDALITGYKVYVNGIVEAILNADQLSYTFTQGKWCNEYAFQVQALTAGETLNSKPSEPLIVTWPGSKPPELRRLPSVSSSTIRVAWSEPYLTDGIKVKHYKLCCVESGSDQIVQSVGPIHPDSKEGEIKNIKKGNYSVYLEIHLYGTDTVIKTEPFPMQPALSPDPPNISVALVGLEERRQIEKFTCDLVNKRDRLIREVGHKLKKIGALTFPMRAEKNEEVVMGAHSLTHIEELLESCFSSLDSYTGQLTAIVSWQCPQSNPDMQVSEYKLLVDGKQYGSSIPSGAKSIRIQLGLEQSSYKITMVACSDKPQGTSDESNAVEVLALTFKPFTYYCYHGIHIKDTKYPNKGCCKFQDSIAYERQIAKKLANQGLLQKHVPPPSCNVLDIFEGDYKPLLSVHKPSCPTVLLFWTPWCLSSQKLMNNFTRFAQENNSLMSYIAVSCGMPGVSNEGKKSLKQIITSNGWFEDRVIWHVTTECGSNVYRAIKKHDSKTDRQKDKSMDLADILGIAGVPTFLFIHPEGYIAWHGRYCAYDYPSFEAFMKHTLSEVLRQPCYVFHCDSCKGETTVDEVMALQLPSVISASQTRHLAARSHSPTSSSDRISRSDMKYAAINGYTNSVSGTDRVFVTETSRQRSSSPRLRPPKRSNISVNRRPYSATNNDAQNMLDKSPYLACVAPHIHQPHKLMLRPASAKKLMHYV